MSTMTQQKQSSSEQVQQPGQQGASQSGAATDMSSFGMDTAVDYQGSLGNQGVQTAAGLDEGQEASGDQETDGPAKDALIAAMGIASGQPADPSGPWSDALFRMMCTLHAAEVDEMFHLSGEEAVVAAENAR